MRSERLARVSCASTDCICSGQRVAPAQLPSSAIRSGPVPSDCSSAGFSTGPANPRMIAATARMRSSNSHHGVLSVTDSSSSRPNRSATPGNRRRTGAGGMARSSSQSSGSANSATKSQGAVNPMPPRTVICTLPMPRRRRAIAAPTVLKGWCGAGHTASR